MSATPRVLGPEDCVFMLTTVTSVDKALPLADRETARPRETRPQTRSARAHPQDGAALHFATRQALTDETARQAHLTQAGRQPRKG